MRIQKSKSKNKLIIIVIALSLLVAGSLDIYLFTRDKATNSSSNTSQTTDGSAIENNGDNEVDGDETDDQPTRPSNDGTINNDNDVIQRSPIETDNASLTITRLDTDGTNIIATVITQGVNDGNCVFIFSQNDVRVTQSSPIQAGPSYFACQVTIPRANFTTAGAWNVTVVASNQTQRASGSGQLNI